MLPLRARFCLAGVVVPMDVDGGGSGLLRPALLICLVEKEEDDFPALATIWMGARGRRSCCAVEGLFTPLTVRTDSESL